MKRNFLILVFFVCCTLGYGQNFLVPHSALYDGIVPTRSSALEGEYLLNESNGYIAEYAFGGGHALTHSKNLLCYTEYEKVYLHRLLNDTTMDVRYPELLHRYKLEVPDSVVVFISRMIKEACLTSSYLFNSVGCDGVMYYFNPYYETASCWSPHGGRCKDLVEVLSRCGKAVKAGCLDSVLAVVPECRRLIRSFRRDYPGNASGGGIYIRFESETKSWREERDYIDLHQNGLDSIERRLFTETDCFLRRDRITVKDNGKDNYRLEIRKEGYTTLFLDSLHFTPEEIFKVAQHIGVFEPGEYRYHPDTESFEWVAKIEEEIKETTIEDVLADCEEEEEDAEDEEEVMKTAFPLLKITNKELFSILDNSVKLLDRDSVPGNILTLKYVDRYWTVIRADGIPEGAALGYFKWKGQNVFVLTSGYISYERGPLLPDMEYFAKVGKNGDNIEIPHKERIFTYGYDEPCYPAFVIENGKIRQYLTTAIVKEAYQTAVQQILSQKGLSIDEANISATLSPIPAEYENKGKTKYQIRTYQDEGYDLPYLRPFQSPFKKLNSVVDKGYFKLSTIKNGYFVVRFTDQQGNNEYYRFQIGEDCSVSAILAK